MRLDGPTRIMIVVAVAGGVFAGWQYLQAGPRGPLNNHAGFPPMFDPFGLLPSSGTDVAAQPRLRLPPGLGNASADIPAAPQDPLPRRWRDCWPDQNGRFQCGQWHEGTPPARGRR